MSHACHCNRLSDAALFEQAPYDLLFSHDFESLFSTVIVLFALSRCTSELTHSLHRHEHCLAILLDFLINNYLHYIHDVLLTI